MAERTHLASPRAALFAALLLLAAAPASAQAPAATWLQDDAALATWMPGPAVRLRLRAGNRVLGGDHELALSSPVDGVLQTGQRAWAPYQHLPFRVTWDGAGRVTFSVGSQLMVADVPGGVSCLALRAVSSHRGAAVAVSQLEVNHHEVGTGPRARSLDGAAALEALLLQGGDLAAGFVLRGKVRLSWIQPPPTGDGLVLDLLLGHPASPGQDYCAATVNSTGVACDLSWSGTTSLSAGSPWLHADGGVPSAACLVLTSPAAQATPLGNGWLCVGPGIERVGDFRAFDAAGRLSLALPLDQAPLAGLVPGEIRNFQVWYRDAAGSPAPYNLSDAVALLFLL